MALDTIRGERSEAFALIASSTYAGFTAVR
jgi:hypothetical protein